MAGKQFSNKEEKYSILSFHNHRFNNFWRKGDCSCGDPLEGVFMIEYVNQIPTYGAN